MSINILFFLVTTQARCDKTITSRDPRVESDVAGPLLDSVNKHLTFKSDPGSNSETGVSNWFVISIFSFRAKIKSDVGRRVWLHGPHTDSAAPRCHHEENKNKLQRYFLFHPFFQLHFFIWVMRTFFVHIGNYTRAYSVELYSVVKFYSKYFVNINSMPILMQFKINSL